MNSSMFLLLFFLFFVKVVAPPYGWDGLKKLFQRATRLKPQLLVDNLVKKYESITEEKSQGELPRGTDEAGQICPK